MIHQRERLTLVLEVKALAQPCLPSSHILLILSPALEERQRWSITTSTIMDVQQL